MKGSDENVMLVLPQRRKDRRGSAESFLMDNCSPLPLREADASLRASGVKPTHKFEALLFHDDRQSDENVGQRARKNSLSDILAEARFLFTSTLRFSP